MFARLKCAQSVLSSNERIVWRDADTFENENWIFLLFTLSRKRTHHVRN